MRQRIVLLALTVVTIAVAALLIPAAWAIRNSSLYSARLELEREAAQLVSSLGPDEELLLENLARIKADPDSDLHTIALYRPNGALADGVGPAAADPAVSAALRGEFGEERIGEEHSVTVPIPRPGGLTAALRVAESYDNPLADARTEVIQLILLTLVIIGSALALAWWFARRLTRPLVDLRAAASEIGGGNFVVPVPETGVAELDDLGHALTSMAQRIEHQVERERAFPTQVSHQLRTPITAMRVALETELQAPRDDPRVILGEALGVLDRMERTVTELLQLTRGQPDDRDAADLSAVCAALASRWGGRFGGVGRRLVVDAVPATIHVSRSALRHILEVLLENSLQHGRGIAYLRVDKSPTATTISVADSAKLTGDPFLVPARSGHGIGLKLARTLAEAEGATLAVVDAKGNRFELRFPAESIAPMPSPVPV